MIVEKISSYLLNNDLIPIYWVNVENKASMQLAKSLEFNEFSTELVLKSI